MSLEQEVEIAKIAEQAERYEDMAKVGLSGRVRFYALVSQQLLSGSHDSLGRGC